jgi:hypothetical protein
MDTQLIGGDLTELGQVQPPLSVLQSSVTAEIMSLLFQARMELESIKTLSIELSF